MNSEELELSLRTEFEIYLKNVLAGMQQDVADFQKNFEAEFEKHRSQMDSAIRSLTDRFGSEIKFDKAFTESVVEHLRLARDDGAQLSANAFNEAQRLEVALAPAHYDEIRDAIDAISSQTMQSAILKCLVDHVSNFASRGAFFIVKNDTLICWRRFDRTRDFSDDGAREINLPLSADTLLSDSVRRLTTTDNFSSSHAEDRVYLDALEFGAPDRMFAVPLIARGRGVAVLYADSGISSEPINLEAIESLVRVAGLTVELRAATSPQSGIAEAPSYIPIRGDESVTHVEVQAETSTESESVSAVEEPTDFAEYTGDVAAVEEVEEISEIETAESEAETSGAEDIAYFEPVATTPQDEASSDEIEAGYGESVDPTPAEKVNDFAFAPSDDYDASAGMEPESVDEYEYTDDTANGSNGRSFEASPEPVVEVASAPTTKSRLSDRNVDLPIEVADDERRFHNDARRFARLLVSEIKLYNEQKVNEGRDSSDLYDRLREAIDRSREMYDKRVKPQVAAKFDYFHYELVSNLAEGHDAKLGGSYPGAAV